MQHAEIETLPTDGYQSRDIQLADYIMKTLSLNTKCGVIVISFLIGVVLIAIGVIGILFKSYHIAPTLMLIGMTISVGAIVGANCY